jgi:hypothetical protein
MAIVAVADFINPIARRTIMFRFKPKLAAVRLLYGGVRGTAAAFSMVFGLLALVCSLAARANVVADWDAIASTTITPPPGTVLPPAVTESEQRPNTAADLATLHVAIYDAVNAIDRQHEPFAVVAKARAAGASQEAAVVGAAYGVLKGLFPGHSMFYQAVYDAYAANVGLDTSKVRGLAIGAEVAAGVLELRQHDGRMTPATYVSTGAPGDFVPGPTALVGLSAPFIKPFAIRRASQFRAPGPPALASEKYAEDLHEVQAMGSAAGVLRTADQSDLARFYSEPPGLYTPRNYRRFASDSQSIADNARLLALLWVANADSGLGCFESKYYYRFWRPRTAIPRADEDGNPETIADAGWAPFLPTPNHPEYPAGHTCADGSLAEGLRQFYGTKKIHFTIDSSVAGLMHPVHAFTSTDVFVKEVGDARVFGGMHFRNSTNDGARLGRRTTKWIAERFFRRVDDK